MLNLLFKCLTLILTLTCFQLKAQGDEQKPKPSLTIANPLDLKKNWWVSYNVGLDDLKEHVLKTKNELDQIRSTLIAEEHKPILQEIDRLIFNFDHLLKQKERELQKEPSQLLLLKEYTIEDIASVNKTLQSSIVKLQQLKVKSDSEKRKLSRLKNKFQNQVTAYTKAAPSSILKLEIGVSMMNLRIEEAILEKEIELTEGKINFLESQKEQLEEELRYAQNHLVLNSSVHESIGKKIEESKIAYENALQQVESVKKRAFYEEENNFQDELLCCLWDYKVLKKTVKAEVTKVKLMVTELQFLLINLMNDGEHASFSEVQKEIKPYYDEISEAQANINQWEATLKQEQTHISKQVDIALAEDTAGHELIRDQVTDISIEINRVQANIEEMKLLITQLRFFLDEITNSLIKHKSLQETWYLMAEKQVQSAYDWVSGILSYSLFQHQHQTITVSNLLGGVLIICGALLFGRFLKSYIYTNKSIFRNLNNSTKYILTRCVNHICFLLGVVIALSYIGFDFTNFFIIAGALGVGIGFGLQSPVNNIFSGFLLLFQRNIKVGDIVELDSKWIGKVCEINLQNTRIHSFEGVDLIVPNSQLTSQMLNNWTLNDTVRRFRIPFHVDIGVDKEKVKEVVLEVTEKIQAVKNRDLRYDNPQLWIKSFGEFGTEFEVVVWVDLTIPMPRGIASATILWEVETALANHGITISYPRRSLVVEGSQEKKQSPAFN